MTVSENKVTMFEHEYIPFADHIIQVNHTELHKSNEDKRNATEVNFNLNKVDFSSI